MDQTRMTCAVLKCGAWRNLRYYLSDGWESSALLGFLVVVAVRVLFLAGEHAVLLRMMRFYQRVNSVASLATPSVPGTTHKASSKRSSGDQLFGGEIVVETAISFKREVRELLSGNNTWTTYVLIMSIFVQVVHWFSGQKTWGGPK
jgi:hypothetical protein